MQEVYLEVVLGSTPQGGWKQNWTEGESTYNAFAVEASAHPTSFSGAGVPLQRCPELIQEVWALGLLHDWMQAPSNEGPLPWVRWLCWQFLESLL